ncbi:uncharacterized protein LOC108022200 [Drosophila biarmipes]|uniref:uncharacterized protein LOC108022200 n=1 Tax=Drosophila biarmipes TaxID=125945 RepID=UPI0007E5E27C|nr:uncharacterized protein LOC108022200 [Drosophila biarmipes]XP_050743786.1 uncharacterized protein LOC108022200 [Drosophila biarmipes]
MAGSTATYSETDRIWSGAKRTSTYNQDTSVGKIIFNTMKTWPKNVCQINDVDGLEVTYEQALSWAIRIAQFFKKRELGHKDVIGIAMQSSTYSMPLGVACLLNGTPFHSISTLLDEATTAHVFSITKPKLIFCDGTDVRKIQAATIGWSPDIYTLTDHVEGVLSIETLLDPTATERMYQPEPLKEGAGQTVVILCSSGTTGLPKAVCISNGSLINDTMVGCNEVVIYTPSCLDWLTGLVTFIFNTVLGVTRVITNKPFTPEYFVEIVKKYKIHVAVLPPRYLSALTSSPHATPEALASIKNIHYTGGWVSSATLKKAQELCNCAILSCGYGMTEMGIVTSNAGIHNLSSVGRPVPGVRMRIVDEEGKNLTYNQVGELYVHTDLHWNGYYGNPEETHKLRDSEGWYHTGDLGYFDEHNFLYIVDRKKEMLRYEYLSYWPTEIESVISKLPQVQEVCVVGIYDERVGDEAGALVVKVPGSEISAQDIVDHVAKHLPAKEKQLYSGVQFTEKLPSSANGKTLRKASREEFLAKRGANT